MGKWGAVLEAVFPSILDCACRCALGGARGVHGHRQLGPPTNAARPGTRHGEEDVAPVDLVRVRVMVRVRVRVRVRARFRVNPNLCSACRMLSPTLFLALS